jgi:hypothetical protein
MQPLIRHEPGLDTPEKDEAETIAGIEEALTEILETARISPRIELAAHRPLGSVNRACRLVCGMSAHFAARFGCPVHEPADARLPG